jgi:hypothetical protein
MKKKGQLIPSVGITFLLLSLLLLTHMATRQLLPNKKFLLAVASVIVFGGVVFFLHHTQANSDSAPTDVATRDAQRISDLKQIQSELNIYDDKCGYYPGVAATPHCGKYETNNTWAGLSAALTGSSIGITSVPNDPTAGANYTFMVTNHGFGYVLGAKLEDPTNSALTQSLHGLVGGVDCDSPMYCVQI